MKKIKILAVFGTRPEAIKMAPLILKMREYSAFDVKICVTAQHREMLDQVMKFFELTADYDLNLMSPGQNLSEITSKAIVGLTKIYSENSPDLVLVHGDTTTTASAALAAYYEKIPIGHIEAGLRTGDIYSPWPEEVNRKITATIASLNFAPTLSAKENLLNEGVSSSSIFVTGNTVIDALLIAKRKIDKNVDLKEKLNQRFSYLENEKKLILVTGHRRENFGVGFENICKALKLISQRDDVQIIYPVHFNPNVQEPVRRILGMSKNIKLIEPLEYIAFVYLMSKSHFILTDSGGIQEEAPALGKPVLVMRNTTERPEAVEAGTAKLIGTKMETILDGVNQLLDKKDEYLRMSDVSNPYGEGRSSEIIANIIQKNFEGSSGATRYSLK
jgi:UDP-N-acetylglucosamine 2-epimerase (non-hydrolysing)